MKLVHLCLVVQGAVGLVVFWVGGLWGLIGKALLYGMLWMMFSSFWYSSCFKLYESNLLNRNLTVAYLWCVGWLELWGMMVSVNVGFLYMVVLIFVGVLCMVTSR